MLTEKSAKELEVLRDALKSGDFKKTKGTLHLEGGGFCCIGVDAIVNGKMKPEEIMVTQQNFIENGYEGPFHVYKNFDKRFSSRLKEDLTELNDRSASFDPVIEKIEEELAMFYAKAKDVKYEK